MQFNPIQHIYMCVLASLLVCMECETCYIMTVSSQPNASKCMYNLLKEVEEGAADKAECDRYQV